ncbi:MAG: hypothetical protein ACAH95_03605 [Fimbriimonas sp.]
MRVANVPIHGWLATPTRRNALKGIFIAPSLLMLGIAAQSNPSYVDYDSLISNREIDARITNYVGVVRETEQMMESGASNPDKLRKVASHWASEAKAGRLLPLPPQGAEDTFMVGVKSQIMSNSRNLATRLCNHAHAEAEKKQYDRAAQDFVLAMQVLQPIRYSDATTMAIVSGRQRQIVKQLMRFWHRVSPNVRMSVKPFIASLEGDKEQLERVIREEHRVAAIAFAQAEEMAVATGDVPDTALRFTASAELLADAARRADESSRKAVAGIL